MIHRSPAGVCDMCGWTMCWQGEKTPDTRIRRVEGRCMVCWRSVARRKVEPVMVAPKPDTSVMDREWMDSYVRDRRRRRVHPDGIILDGEEPRRKSDAWVFFGDRDGETA